MVTGRTEEEICTEGTAVREDREEGKRKNGKLSSQNLNESGRKKAIAREKYRKRKHKVSTCGTAVGAKQGRTKGNLQKAEYENRERRHGKPGRKERGKPKEAKAEIGTPKKPRC